MFIKCYIENLHIFVYVRTNWNIIEVERMGKEKAYPFISSKDNKLLITKLKTII